MGVKGGSCCDDFNTGLRSFCIAQEDNPTGDKYCMPYGLSSGSVCGMTAASNFAGIRDASLGCVNGTCGTTTTTTTTTSTTTTTGACIATGVVCWDSTGPVGSATCCGTGG